MKKLLIMLLSLSLLGCQNTTNNEFKDNNNLNVVATTTMLTDLLETIGKDKLNVIGLMGPGIDPHQYKASANDVTIIQNADIIVNNGIGLEGKMAEVLESLDKQDKHIITVGDNIDPSLLLSDPSYPDLPDPHIWFDIDLWIKASEYVCENLSTIDPTNKDYYNTNLNDYLNELNELKSYTLDRVNEINPSNRVLITAHDAFSYFAEAYGFKVYAIQGINTDSEASTKDVDELANYIVENKIKAIFMETSISTKNIEALQAAVKAQDFNVEIGGELYSDSIGDDQDGNSTYILSFKSNVDTIVDALK